MLIMGTRRERERERVRERGSEREGEGMRERETETWWKQEGGGGECKCGGVMWLKQNMSIYNEYLSSDKTKNTEKIKK